MTAPAAYTRSRYLPALFFVTLAALGLFTFRDYGMGWDDFLMHHDLGEPVLRYLADPVHRSLELGLATWHGPSLEILESGLTRTLGLRDERAIFLYRHLFTFAVFLAGSWGLYRAARRWFPGAPWHALLVPFFLVLQPRIYADAFYNGKDVGYLAILCLALWSGERLRERPAAAGRLLTHAAACGFLVGVRIIGVMVPFADFLLILLPALRRTGGSGRAAAARAAALFALATYLATLLCWPSLWSRPLTGLWAAVADNAHFAWRGTVLYRGEFISASRLPWHYLPTWIAITTPVAILALAAAGAFFLARPGTRAPGAVNPLLLRLALICLPPPLVALLARSVIYDGWRHFYFLAVPLAALAAAGFLGARDALAGRPFPRRALATGVAGLLAVTATEMAILHPYQNLYFNELMGRDWRSLQTRYDMDYWGLTYREALEFVARTDASPRIRVWANSQAGLFSAMLLPEADRNRLIFQKKPEGADYLITNYRWQPGGLGAPPAFAVTVYGARVLAVVKVTPAAPPAAPAPRGEPPG